jgi:hypothetical protein
MGILTVVAFRDTRDTTTMTANSTKPINPKNQKLLVFIATLKASLTFICVIFPNIPTLFYRKWAKKQGSSA